MQPDDFFIWNDFTEQSNFNVDLLEQLRKAPLEEVEELDVAYALTRLTLQELRAFDRGRGWRLSNDHFAFLLRSLRAVLKRVGIHFNPLFRDFEGFARLKAGWTFGQASDYVNDLFESIQARLEELEEEPDGAIRGVDGKLKNIIFASTGAKPRIVLRNALDNVIEITKNENLCLFYDQPLSAKGLMWGDIIDWWRLKEAMGDAEDRIVGHEIYKRLRASLDSPAEQALFHAYCKYFPITDIGASYPALLPQVYLHYDPTTRWQRQQSNENDVLERERMDFLLLMPRGVRIVLEVDGKQHYSEGNKASPRLYSEMVAEDRALRLLGYEVYRFGGYELTEDEGATAAMLRAFFSDLIEKHSPKEAIETAQ